MFVKLKEWFVKYSKIGISYCTKAFAVIGIFGLGMWIYTTYFSVPAKVVASIVEASGDISAIDGIDRWNVQVEKGVTVIYPKTITTEEKVFINEMTNEKPNNSAVIFGKVASDQYISDMTGENSIDLSEVLKRLKVGGIKSIYGYWSNPRKLFYPVTFSSVGNLHIDVFDDRRLGFLWKTGAKILKYESENMKDRIEVTVR